MSGRSSSPLEIEVKFYVPEVETLRRRILAMGVSSHGRVFEQNIRFEDASNSLRAQGTLLRLRKDDRARLTFKSSISDMPGGDDQFKIHRELELQVDDFDVCRSILECLGFHPAQVYEKWRETFVIDETKLLIDTMPYGVFLEIEGNRSDIRRTADRLGLRWEDRILLNYLEIFDILRREEGLTFNDVTFENLEKSGLDAARYLRLLCAG